MAADCWAWPTHCTECCLLACNNSFGLWSDLNPTSVLSLRTCDEHRGSSCSNKPLCDRYLGVCHACCISRSVQLTSASLSRHFFWRTQVAAMIVSRCLYNGCQSFGQGASLHAVAMCQSPSTCHWPISQFFNQDLPLGTVTQAWQRVEVQSVNCICPAHRHLNKMYRRFLAHCRLRRSGMYRPR